MKKPVKIAMLLDGGIRYDARVSRIAKSLSRLYQVHLFYIHPTDIDTSLFEGTNVKLFPIQPGNSYKNKLNHLLFIHKKFTFFYDAVLNTGEEYSVIHANDYPTLAVAEKLANTFKAQLVYDAHEIYLETVNQFYPTDVPFYKKLLYQLLILLSRKIGSPIEKKLITKSNVFITTSPSFAQYFHKVYQKKDIHIVMNCPELRPVEKNNLFHKKYKLVTEDKIVLYQGLLNLGRGLEELVRSAEFLPENYKIVILGFGMLEDKLQQIVKEKSLQHKVLFHEKVDHKDLLTYTSSADLGVLILDPVNISKQLASANKIFEYMAAGIPVFATALPENKRIIEECDSGYLIEHKTPEHIADSIIKAFEDDDFLNKGRNGKRCFQNTYNWNEQEKNLLKAYEKLN